MKMRGKRRTNLSRISNQARSSRRVRLMESLEQTRVRRKSQAVRQAALRAKQKNELLNTINDSKSVIELFIKQEPGIITYDYWSQVENEQNKDFPLNPPVEYITTNVDIKEEPEFLIHDCLDQCVIEETKPVTFKANNSIESDNYAEVCITNACIKQEKESFSEDTSRHESSNSPLEIHNPTDNACKNF